MFRLAPPDQVYDCPLTVQVPTHDGTEAQRGTVRYRLIPASQATRLAREGDAALADAVLVGWRDICAADGEPLAVSDAHRATLLDIPYFQRAVVLEYLRFAAGIPGKNSEAPRAIS